MSVRKKKLSAATKKELAIRPETYWPESLDRDQLLSRIKGQARRELAGEALAKHGIRGLDDFIGRSELEDDQRQVWGAIHPAMMGGEYLPSLDLTEIEIARISLRSTTFDQISIRARFEGGKIRYRVVDEYESTFVLAVDNSEQPFSLGEFIEFIEGSSQGDASATGGLLQSHWNFNYEYGGGGEESVDFASIESAWYPGLVSWYHGVAEDWIEEREPEEVD